MKKQIGSIASILSLAVLSACNMEIGTSKDTQALAEVEKCFGVAKAGKNDCGNKEKGMSCAGTSTQDHDPNAWIYIQKGQCEKIANGSLEPQA